MILIRIGAPASLRFLAISTDRPGGLIAQVLLFHGQDLGTWEPWNRNSSWGSVVLPAILGGVRCLLASFRPRNLAGWADFAAWRLRPLTVLEMATVYA